MSFSKLEADLLTENRHLQAELEKEQAAHKATASKLAEASKAVEWVTAQQRAQAFLRTIGKWRGE